ncbi:MAG: PadR family transcriptional regulator [archaeon]|nr:PadR family transcriptional regulator [archaeon]
MRTSSNEYQELKKVRVKCVRGFLEVLILTTLREKEMSGYDLIGFIYKTFEVLLSPGTLYPNLNSLEQLGLIEARNCGRKKVYKLTSKGDSLCHSLSLEYMKVTSKAAFLKKENQELIKRSK